MRGVDRNSFDDRQSNREALNKKIRDRFEKEAHDREREDIDIVVDIHRRFVDRNALMQLMK